MDDLIEIGIPLASLISSIVAFTVSCILIYDWKKTRKQQRLEWGIGMLTYAMGHFIFFLMKVITEDTPLLVGNLCDYFPLFPGCPDVYILWLWIYINLGGAITMALILKGILPIFTNKSLYIYGIPIGFALIYGIGSFLYGFVFDVIWNLPEDNIFELVMLGQFFPGDLHQDPSNIANMSWFIVECLIIVSFIIGFLFIMHYKELKKEGLKARPSLLISIHFFGYTLLLFIWPFGSLEEIGPIFHLLFYSGRTIITTILAIGFIDLIRSTEEINNLS